MFISNCFSLSTFKHYFFWKSSSSLGFSSNSASSMENTPSPAPQLPCPLLLGSSHDLVVVRWFTITYRMNNVVWGLHRGVSSLTFFLKLLPAFWNCFIIGLFVRTSTKMVPLLYYNVYIIWRNISHLYISWAIAWTLLASNMLRRLWSCMGILLELMACLLLSSIMSSCSISLIETFLFANA